MIPFLFLSTFQTQIAFTRSNSNLLSTLSKSEQKGNSFNFILRGQHSLVIESLHWHYKESAKESKNAK